MKESKIKFVREYVSYGYTWYDIVYKSGRVYSIDDEDCPKTAKQFISGKTPEKQYDRTFNRDEYIYS